MDVNWETIILAAISAVTGAFGLKGFDFVLGWAKGTRTKDAAFFKQYDLLHTRLQSRVDALESELHGLHGQHVECLQLNATLQGKLAVQETTIRLQEERIESLEARLQSLEETGQ